MTSAADFVAFQKQADLPEFVIEDSLVVPECRAHLDLLACQGTLFAAGCLKLFQDLAYFCC
jgi:hypothetical protein